MSLPPPHKWPIGALRLRGRWHFSFVRLAAAVMVSVLALGCVSPSYYYSGGGYGTLVDASGRYQPSVSLPPPARSVLGPVPARLAVAEVGEWSPPRAVIHTLREQKNFFATVIAVPGRGPTQYYGRTPRGPSLTRSLGETVSDTIEAARRSGADYLLLLSAYAHTDTADVIRGVPPERQKRAPLRLCQWTEGKAATMLVRVRDCTVVHTAATARLRKDPAVLPGTQQWFYGRPSTLLARSMMLDVTEQMLQEISHRTRPSGRALRN
jgi:hypothetical protein